MTEKNDEAIMYCMLGNLGVVVFAPSIIPRRYPECFSVLALVKYIISDINDVSMCTSKHTIEIAISFRYLIPFVVR